MTEQMIPAAAIRAWRDKYQGCTGNNALAALDALIPAPPTTPKGNPEMPDQTLDEQVRPIVAAMRAAMRRDAHAYPEAKFLSDMSGYIKDLEALLPARPTLADMTMNEQDDCVGMQADLAQGDRVVILDGTPDHDDRVQVLETTLDVFRPLAVDVTPRPDLPRMVWPGDKKPTPALPEGWRIADHPDYGRVVVTTPEPDEDGEVYFVFRDDELSQRHDIYWCKPAELTYIDQEADTADTVPESTLAVGSVWSDINALTEACEETGRDQIAVTDKDGDVYVWDGMAECWEDYTPPRHTPCTIIHAGKKADQ